MTTNDINPVCSIEEAIAYVASLAGDDFTSITSTNKADGWCVEVIINGGKRDGQIYHVYSMKVGGYYAAQMQKYGKLRLKNVK